MRRDPIFSYGSEVVRSRPAKASADDCIYEIHGYVISRWEHLQTSYNREDAIAAAVKLRRNLSYLSLRVTELRYDERSAAYVSRTVYRHRQTLADHIAGRAPARPPPSSPAIRKPRPPDAKKTFGFMALYLRLIFLLVAGLLVLVWLSRSH
jgi:hypothetical protein